jgi:hypothetical protein
MDSDSSIPICNHCWASASVNPDHPYHVANKSSDVCGYPGHYIGAFVVGETYLTQDGKEVTILDQSTVPSYEAVKGSDLNVDGNNIWRYNRPNDRGRVTGSNFDMSDPRNLVVK